MFCVGWQKTGTKSLGRALQWLGFSVASFRAELTYRWHEGRYEKLVGAASRDNAFEDFPWALAFRELDRAFPDAKFILTTRRTDAVWLDSYQRHVERIPRWVGHYLIYGSYDPVADAERHVSIYRQHNEDVRRHFSGRPGKLLEMRFEQQDGWAPLCSFLGRRDVPAVPFPHLNTRERPLVPRAVHLERRARATG